ncbi:MAG: type II/IV secretion system ATPase subunit [Candidatus Saliniplasma sp.]
MNLLKELRQIEGRKVEKGINKVFSGGQDVRPGFSYTWVRERLPSMSKKVLEYGMDGTTVRLYRLLEETEDLYHISPSEYQVDKDTAELILSVKGSLSEQFPRDIDLSKPFQVKKYITNHGRALLERTAEKLGITLGKTREEEMKKIEFLSEILAKYTAGYGIIETLLEDPNVEDIYVDAPSDNNNIYVEIGGLEGIREKCRTNIFLSQKDMKSILSRFRSESGKPFSEAFPVLETELEEYGTRVTAIGNPLSPDGMAFALRRRDTEPWTLPKLIKVGSLTPTAAGLLSFLIDGRSTILVAGSRGAGKTTLLGALMLEFPKSQRILTIEDTRELPSREMQGLDYNIQSMLVDSSLEEGGMNADQALRVSLRLGESSLVLGEVRGEEARTLYEAMRAGTAGSAVMGTIHGNSPDAVYERVVHDMGISQESFGATDIIVIAGIVRPGGMQERKRTVTHISEYDDQEFDDLMNYQDGLEPTDHLKRNSEKIGSIARDWSLTYEKAVENIELRAYIREKMVEVSEEKGDELLSPAWVARVNDKFWNLIEKHYENGSYENVKEDWTEWYEERVRYE